MILEPKYLQNFSAMIVLFPAPKKIMLSPGFTLAFNSSKIQFHFY